MTSFPLARSPQRRATTMDRIRVEAFTKRMAEGEDPSDAAWAVFSDPATGLQQYRGGGGRPSPIVLRRKLAALLQRTVPEVALAAKDVALSRLSALSDDALRAVEEVVNGDFSDGAIARARLDAARVILGSLGLSEKGGGVTVATQVTVAQATQFRGVPEGA